MTQPNDQQYNTEMLRLSQSSIRDGKNIYAGHYDEDGIYHLHGGGTLSPEGLLTDPYGERRGGAIRHRVRLSDGALTNAIPQRDGLDTRPNPPLVPTCHGWPSPPEGAGWPNLDNPTWLD